MINTLAIAFALALTVNWAVYDLQYYWTLSEWTGWKFWKRKPFNCAMCLSFWVGLGVSLITLDYIILAPLTSAIAAQIYLYNGKDY